STASFARSCSCARVPRPTCCLLRPTHSGLLMLIVATHCGNSLWQLIVEADGPELRYFGPRLDPGAPTLNLESRFRVMSSCTSGQDFTLAPFEGQLPHFSHPAQPATGLVGTLTST